MGGPLTPTGPASWFVGAQIRLRYSGDPLVLDQFSIEPVKVEVQTKAVKSKMLQGNAKGAAAAEVKTSLRQRIIAALAAGLANSVCLELLEIDSLNLLDFKTVFPVSIPRDIALSSVFAVLVADVVGV